MTGIAVSRITPLGHGFRIDAGPTGAFDARAVVVATQPHVAAALIENIDAAAAAAAASIEAPPLAVVFLGYKRKQIDHPLDGLGYLTPQGEGRALTGALFRSTMFEGRAPEDHVALAAYLGGDRAPDLALREPRELVALVRAEFRDLLGVRGDPVIQRVRQWSRGSPRYRVGHRRIVAEFTGAERRHPGLFVTGNYIGGPSIASCLGEAKKTARRAAGYLRRRNQATTRLDREAGSVAL